MHIAAEQFSENILGYSGQSALLTRVMRVAHAIVERRNNMQAARPLVVMFPESHVNIEDHLDVLGFLVVLKEMYGEAFRVAVERPHDLLRKEFQMRANQHLFPGKGEEASLTLNCNALNADLIYDVKLAGRPEEFSLGLGLLSADRGRHMPAPDGNPDAYRLRFALMRAMGIDGAFVDTSLMPAIIKDGQVEQASKLDIGDPETRDVLRSVYNKTLDNFDCLSILNEHVHQTRNQYMAEKIQEISRNEDREGGVPPKIIFFAVENAHYEPCAKALTDKGMTICEIGMPSYTRNYLTSPEISPTAQQIWRAIVDTFSASYFDGEVSQLQTIMKLEADRNTTINPRFDELLNTPVSELSS